MYLNHTKGCNSCVSKKLISNISINKHAYGNANLVPIALPKACFLMLLLNSKRLFFKANPSTLTKSPVGMDFLPSLFKASLRSAKPASWDIILRPL